jgi:hypothetical protein
VDQCHCCTRVKVGLLFAELLAVSSHRLAYVTDLSELQGTYQMQHNVLCNPMETDTYHGTIQRELKNTCSCLQQYVPVPCVYAEGAKSSHLQGLNMAGPAPAGSGLLHDVPEDLQIAE